MTTVDMTVREGDAPGYVYRESIATTETGEDVRVPSLGRASIPITITLICSSSTGKAQFTTSPDAMVEAGTAVWQDWDLGAISATATDVLNGSVTGLRGVSTTGTVIIEILI